MSIFYQQNRGIPKNGKHRKISINLLDLIVLSLWRTLLSYLVATNSRFRILNRDATSKRILDAYKEKGILPGNDIGTPRISIRSFIFFFKMTPWTMGEVICRITSLYMQTFFCRYINTSRTTHKKIGTIDEARNEFRLYNAFIYIKVSKND